MKIVIERGTSLPQILKEEGGEIMTDDLRQNVETLIELRQKEAELKKQLQILREEIANTETKIAEELGMRGITSINYKDLGKVTVKSTLYPQIKNREELIRFLKETGNEILVNETVNPQTLRAFLLELAAQGQDPNIPGVKVWEKFWISISK